LIYILVVTSKAKRCSQAKFGTEIKQTRLKKYEATEAEKSKKTTTVQTNEVAN
jgi:hypothetical protein